MSALFRFVRTQGFKKRLISLASKDVKVHNIARCGISSTPKRSDTTSEESYPVKKTWVSYGFDYEDERLDRHYLSLMFFGGITVCIIGGSFIMAYLPDPSLKEWAQREGYLQLRHREEHGLPVIDINVVDPSKFTLPTDEELGITPIII